MVVLINLLTLVKVRISWVVSDEGCSYARDSVATNIIVMCHRSFISQQVCLPCGHGDLIVWTQQSGFNC